jgi:hypothetical protein
MPSYYDSTKKKPGKAKLKYAEGGKVKKEGEWKPYSLVVKEKAESGEVTTKLIPYVKPPRLSVFGKKMAKGGKVKKMAKGGKVKKMVHGGPVEPKTIAAGMANGHDLTLARPYNSASRKQIFGKNG